MKPSEIFNWIDAEFPGMHGWCTEQRASELAGMVLALRPAVTVCCGVWGGRDTFALAMAHRSIGFGQVIAIDPWKAAASAAGQTGEDLKWWNDQSKHDAVYRDFIARRERYGLMPYIELHKKSSRDVTVPKHIGVLIVDANHGPEAIEDTKRFARNVKTGGFVYMDDEKWAGGAVTEAIKALEKMGFYRLFDRDTGAFFQRA